MSSAGSLFFEGDLQAGISLAISHDKITVCFVAGQFQHLTLSICYRVETKTSMTDRLLDVR